MTDYTKELLGIIDEQNQTIKRLVGERDQLRAHLDGLGERLDALTCLQRAYNDPAVSEANRIKAAAAAIAFERSKLTLNVRVGPATLGDRLDRAMKTVEEPRTIEHQPAA